jgi:hypothetical protein
MQKFTAEQLDRALIGAGFSYDSEYSSYKNTANMYFDSVVNGEIKTGENGKSQYMLIRVRKSADVDAAGNYISKPQLCRIYSGNYNKMPEGVGSLQKDTQYLANINISQKVFDESVSEGRFPTTFMTLTHLESGAQGFTLEDLGIDLKIETVASPAEIGAGA